MCYDFLKEFSEARGGGEGGRGGKLYKFSCLVMKRKAVFVKVLSQSFLSFKSESLFLIKKE